MTQTYSQLIKQIASLQEKADRIKQKDVSGVIARMREAIAFYGISEEQLFTPDKAAKEVVARRQVKKLAQNKKRSRTTYADGEGNTWRGLGPRPQWLRDKIAAGASVDDFKSLASVSPASGRQASGQNGSATKKMNGAGSRARKAVEMAPASKAKYSDGSHSWSGRGPKPRWFKDAVEAGKSMDELRVGG